MCIASAVELQLVQKPCIIWVLLIFFAFSITCCNIVAILIWLCGFIATNFNNIVELHGTFSNGDIASLFALLCCVSVSGNYMAILSCWPNIVCLGL
jgi:hypothetical protein